ncbi:ABC transporter permease [Niallia circulans]|uniref:ABC transporter permease n=1 Tax=Niallia circulans TaxID=1397 RepID=A0A0J1IJB5_NIACI|nr:ABC transporter permease [Niallia circulans]KLV26044.1 ABC transporter permease [Niallia circulans]MDR4318750.1 ABC transporter permease [Niallia circulans]MED3840006.1 ABC transporter permease [Niallia circulans]MED4245795.1 ABC transporter permease [Niallia circulans]MED4250356.1 ABC transporter permease [Niallia circulans]
MKSFWMQSKAEIVRTLRNKYYIFWSLLIPVLFYFLFTNIFTAPRDDEALWNVHYLMSMTTFSIMGSSIMTLGIKIVEEKAEGWTIFLHITPLSQFAYFGAKMVAQTVIHLFSIMVIFTAGVLINAVHLSFSQWVLCGIWILFGSLPFLALGTIVGNIKKVETASGISNLLYMSMAITGGMWMPIDVFPSFMQQVAKWVPSYHFANGAWEIIRDQYPSFLNYLMITGYLLLFMVLSIYIGKKREAV